MINKEKILKTLFVTAIFLLCSYIIFLLTVYSRHSSFLFGDDAVSAMYPYSNEGIFDCLRFANHGDGYIGLFLSKFLCFGLPNMLGLHPADFIGIPGGIIRGIFTSLTLLSITNFGVLLKKSRLYYLSCFLLITVLFFISCRNNTIIMCYYNFYRYFFSLLFVSIFLNYIFKNLLNKEEKTDWLKLTAAAICSYAAGTSVEITIFSLVIFVCLLFLYSLTVNKFVKNENILKSLKINTDKNFYIPSLSLITAAILVTSSHNGFQAMAAERGLGQTLITKELLVSFINIFADKYLYDNWILITSLIILSVLSVFFAVKNKEIKVIILPVFFIISIFTTVFSLIFLGKTCYDGGFWLNHTNIIFLYNMLLLFPLLYFLNYMYKNLKELNFPKWSKAEIFIFPVIIAVLSAVMYDIQIHKEPGIQDITLKRKAYMMEKILRFYYLKKERPILPKDIILSEDFGSWDHKNVGEYDRKNKINSSYYPRIYKDNISAELGYSLEDNAFEKFYKAGGTFSADELENIKFSRLFSEDFVLNKQYSDNEIQQILEK